MTAWLGLGREGSASLGGLVTFFILLELIGLGQRYGTGRMGGNKKR